MTGRRLHQFSVMENGSPGSSSLISLSPTTPQVCNTQRAVSPPVVTNAPILSATEATSCASAEESNRPSLSLNSFSLSSVIRTSRPAFNASVSWSLCLRILVDCAPVSKSGGGMAMATTSAEEDSTLVCSHDMAEAEPITNRVGPGANGWLPLAGALAERSTALGRWYASPAEPAHTVPCPNAAVASEIAYRSCAI